MLPPHIRNKFSEHPQKIMRPVSIKLSEEMIALLQEMADEHGFSRLQGLIRLYIRQGLDRDHDGYTLADDEVFIERLRDKGVSEDIIDAAIIDTYNECESTIKLQEDMIDKD